MHFNVTRQIITRISGKNHTRTFTLESGMTTEWWYVAKWLHRNFRMRRSRQEDDRTYCHAALSLWCHTDGNIDGRSCCSDSGLACLLWRELARESGALPLLLLPLQLAR